MEINLQFIINIAPIVLLIIIIFQLKEFRDTWWKEWIAGNMNKSKEFSDQMTGVTEKFEGLNNRFETLERLVRERTLRNKD